MAVQLAALYGREQSFVSLYVPLGHLHIPTGEDGVQLGAALLAPAVLRYGVDELINPRRLCELCDLVSESLGFLF